MRHYRKPSLTARHPERPAVFEEMLAAAKPVGITPRTPRGAEPACPLDYWNQASGWLHLRPRYTGDGGFQPARTAQTPHQVTAGQQVGVWSAACIWESVT